MVVKTISSQMLDKIAVIINSALAHDEVSLQALGELSGTKVQIISNSPQFTIYLKIDSDQVSLSNEGDIEQTITLSGSLVALVSSLFDADEISTLHGTGLTANGDTGVLKKLNKLISFWHPWKFKRGRIFSYNIHIFFWQFIVLIVNFIYFSIIFSVITNTK